MNDVLTVENYTDTLFLKVQLQLQSCFFGVTYSHNNVRSGVVGWWGGVDCTCALI